MIQDNMFFYTSSSVLNKEDFFQLIEDDIKLKKLPFDDELIDFANSLAKKILLSKKLREFPELAPLAQFFKRKNILEFKKLFHENSNELVLPRGYVFHIAPSNVDSIFLYSSLISFICGNCNLIRVSQSLNQQVQFVINIINDLLDNEFLHFQDRMIIFTYPHNQEITQKISLSVDSRVIWGGDSTVNEIRQIPINPSANELAFPDRFSMSIINSEQINKLEKKEFLDLIIAFFNDISWFSQQACSSPRLIIWIGDTKSIEKAKDIFWKNFKDYIMEKNYDDTGGMAMDRFSTSTFLASKDILTEDSPPGEYPTRLNLKKHIDNYLRDSHPGNGIFYEDSYKNLNECANFFRAKDQTISAFGFKIQDIKSFLKILPRRSVDRVVNFGEALDFNVVWDGTNLIEFFTRKVKLPNLK